MTGKPPHPDRATSASGAGGSKPPAHYHAERRDWPAYYDAMRGTPARETLVRALDLFDQEFKSGRVWGAAGSERLAFDLAAGEGRDVQEMLKRGWSVIATDNAEEALQRIAARSDISEDQRARLTSTNRSFEELVSVGLRTIAPNEQRPLLINASFALPFCPSTCFDDLWSQIVETLPHGGRFAGQFFGDRDDWVRTRTDHHNVQASPAARGSPVPGTTHVTRARLFELIEPMVIEFLCEEDRESADRTHAPKRWHLFHVVLRKR